MEKPSKNARITAKVKSKARKSIHEPTFSMLEVPTESELLHNIAWYNLYFDQKQSKDWAMNWIASNTALARHLKDFEAIPQQWFGNKGFFCRMTFNGWQMDNTRKQKFEKLFLDMLDMYKSIVPEVEEKAKTPPVAQITYNAPKLKEDPFWSALVDCEDSIMANKGELNKDIEAALFATINQLTPNGKKRAKRTLEKHRKQLVADVKWAGDGIMHSDGRTSKKIIRVLIACYDKWANKSIKV